MPEASQQEEKRGVTHADLDRAAEAALLEENDAVAEEEETVETTAEETEEVEETEETEEEEDDSEEEVSVETETEEEPAVETKKVKDEENAERSKLGRKVKALEEQIAMLLASKEEPVAEEEFEEDAVITPENLPKYIERENKKREQEQAQYQKNYVGQFSQIGKDDDRFTEIWEEMLENHNSIITGDPKADANINYYKAKAALLEKTKPINPVQGKGKTAKTKVNVPDKIQHKQPKPVKLDPIAAEFVRRQKISNEFVEKTLGGKNG